MNVLLRVLWFMLVTAWYLFELFAWLTMCYISILFLGAVTGLFEIPFPYHLPTYWLYPAVIVGSMHLIGLGYKSFIRIVDVCYRIGQIVLSGFNPKDEPTS